MNGNQNEWSIQTHLKCFKQTHWKTKRTNGRERKKEEEKKKTSNLSPLNYYLWWTSYSPIYIQKQIISHTHAYKLSFSFTFRFLHAKSLYEKHFTKRKIHAQFKYEEKALNLNYYFGSSSLSFTKQQISPKNLF